MPLATCEQAADYYSQEHGGDDAHGRMRGDIVLRVINEVGDFLGEVAELTAQLLFGGEFLRPASRRGGVTDYPRASASASRNGGFCEAVRGLKLSRNQMLVAVFDNETAAFEGLSALRALHKEGGISLYASAVIMKDKTGKVSVKQEVDRGPRRYDTRTAPWWLDRHPRRSGGTGNIQLRREGRRNAEEM
jgi:hypothetical protein